MYKAGYDPTAFVDFFEKIETLEKKSPAPSARPYATHPPTDDRIRAAQEEIQKDFSPRPEYVVNTSDFNQVKARIAMLHGRRKLDAPPDANRPTLRRAPGSGGTVDNNDGGTSSGSDDDRPTLKRRPASED